MPVSLAQALDGLLLLEKTAEISTGPKNFFVHVRVPAHVAEGLRDVQKKILPDASQHAEIDHCTLVFVHKPVDEHSPEKVHAALDALRDIGAKTEPFQAKVQGVAYFDGAKKDGKTNTALVALLDAPGITHLHVDMSRALKDLGIEPSDQHSFTPHITLGYIGDTGRVKTDLPVLSGSFSVDKVHVAARDHHEIPLTGVSTLGRKAAAYAINTRATP